MRRGTGRGVQALRGLGFVERETLRVRSREIMSVVCGFSYVQEVTMVNRAAIPVRGEPKASSP